MPDFDIEPERINVFRIDDTYMFKHFFERTDIFDQLADYYNERKYRFEVPPDDYTSVKNELAKNYYELVVVEDLREYCVVKEQYTNHAEILRDAVVQWDRRGQLFFLMKDQLSVQTAIERGATRIDDTGFVVGL